MFSCCCSVISERLFNSIWYHFNFHISKGCTSTQFNCANGQCVPVASRCNNIRECSDGSDELNCGKHL